MSGTKALIEDDDDADPVPPRVTDAPERIWLVYGDIERDCTHWECVRDGDVGWCEDKQYGSDVAYVIADHADAYAEQMARELLKATAEFAAYKEGSEQAFGDVVDQKLAIEADLIKTEENLRRCHDIIRRQASELDALKVAAQAAAEALQHLGGTLHAQRLLDATRAKI